MGNENGKAVKENNQKIGGNNDTVLIAGLLVLIAIKYLFTKLPWPRDSEDTFPSSSQTTSCPVPIYSPHRWRLSLSLFTAERQAGKL